MKLQTALMILKKAISKNKVTNLEDYFIKVMSERIALEMDKQIIEDLLHYDVG